jgi:hypothetical protein
MKGPERYTPYADQWVLTAEDQRFGDIINRDHGGKNG